MDLLRTVDYYRIYRKETCGCLSKPAVKRKGFPDLPDDQRRKHEAQIRNQSAAVRSTTLKISRRNRMKSTAACSKPAARTPRSRCLPEQAPFENGLVQGTEVKDMYQLAGRLRGDKGHALPFEERFLPADAESDQGDKAI